MSVYGSSGSSGNSIFGPGQGGISQIIDEKFIDTEEIKAYLASVNLTAAINNITPVSSLTTLCNLSESQTLTGAKTFNGGLNASNITLTGTTANGDLILYPRGSSPGNTREIEFKALTNNTHVALKASDSIPTSYTLTLPTSAPSATAFLKSNASGTLSWDQALYASLSSAYQIWNGQNVFDHTGVYPLVLAAGKSIGFTNPAGSATTGLKSGANTSSFDLTLPTALPSTQSLLSCSSTGALSFSNPVGLRLSGTGTADQADLILDPYGSTTRSIRFQEVATNGSNHIALRAPTTLAANSVFELPILPTTNSALLSSSTAGVMGWTNPGTFVQTTTNQTIGGDKTFSGAVSLSGTSGSNTVPLNLFPWNTGTGQTREVRFIALNSSNYTAVKAADTITTYTLTLPNAVSSFSDGLLTSNASGALSFNDGSTYVRTTGDQTIAGVKTFSGTSMVLSNTSATFVSGASTSVGGAQAEFGGSVAGDFTLNIRNGSSGNSAARAVLRLGLASTGPRGRIAVHSNVHSTEANHMTIANETSGGHLRFYTEANPDVVCMRAGTNGTLGIGVALPAYQLELSANSAAKPTSGTWTISSDERLKTDIKDADLDICYQNVKNLPLRRYKWKPEVYDPKQINNDYHRIGFIAQEYQKIFPKDVIPTHFQRTHIEEVDVKKEDEEGERIEKQKKHVVDYELKDCLTINDHQILMTMYGALKKVIEVIDQISNQVEAADYTVSPMQMQISEGYGIVSNSIKHFNNKNVATLSFNFIVDDDVSASEWLELPLLQECKSVMLSNIVYIDEHGFDADRPFKIALSKTTEKLKVSFKNMHLVEKNIQKKLLINYIIS